MRNLVPHMFMLINLVPPVSPDPGWVWNTLDA